MLIDFLTPPKTAFLALDSRGEVTNHQSNIVSLHSRFLDA